MGEWRGNNEWRSLTPDSDCVVVLSGGLGPRGIIRKIMVGFKENGVMALRCL